MCMTINGLHLVRYLLILVWGVVILYLNDIDDFVGCNKAALAVVALNFFE